MTPVEVSNPDRVVFPEDGITKGEVVAFYEAMAPRMLPFIAGRALTVERFPRGTGAKGFMQKNAPDHFGDDLIRRHETPKEGGGTTVYPVVDTEKAIAAFANLGVITFHVPPVTVDDEWRPDWVVWDLDPPPERVDLVREAAHRLRAILDGFGIDTVPMTSGSKGYHLRARAEKTLDIAAAAAMARGVAALASTEHDELLTIAFLKKERGDRVFVDWLRNAPYATSVAPWSLRARPGAPVATPLRWEQVAEVDPDGIHQGEAVDVDPDPWKGTKPADLTEAAAIVEQALADAGIVLEPFDRFRP
jgi:bifunctional non-homologous end joining protein LigD